MVTLEALESRSELREALLSAVRGHRNNPALTFVIVSTRYASGLVAERRILDLFEGENLFLSGNVILKTADQLDIPREVAAHVVLNRAIEAERKIIGAQGLTSDLAVVGEGEYLQKLTRRDTWLIVGEKGAMELALLLVQFGDTQKLTEKFGFMRMITPSEQLIVFFAQFRLADRLRTSAA